MFDKKKANQPLRTIELYIPKAVLTYYFKGAGGMNDNWAMSKIQRLLWNAIDDDLKLRAEVDKDKDAKELREMMFGLIIDVFEQR